MKVMSQTTLRWQSKTQTLFVQVAVLCSDVSFDVSENLSKREHSMDCSQRVNADLTHRMGNQLPPSPSISLLLLCCLMSSDVG